MTPMRVTIKSCPEPAGHQKKGFRKNGGQGNGKRHRQGGDEIEVNVALPMPFDPGPGGRLVHRRLFPAL